MSDITVIARAETRDYSNCPVSLALDAGQLPAEKVQLVEEGTGKTTWGQVSTCGDKPCLTWIIKSIKKGEEKRYAVVPGRSARPPVAVRLTQTPDNRVEVRIRGVLFTSYYFGTEWARPFLHPLYGPTGAPVTRQYPMVQVEGETRDHHHHKGCFVAWGDVNGTDNWSETEGHGRVVHQEFLELANGPVFGRIRVLNHWESADGEKVMEEVREYTFYDQPSRARSFDLSVTFKATEGKARFGDTKEGGIASIRVATSMDGNKGGRIENAFGGVSEKETWGKRAHWCDYSGPVAEPVARDGAAPEPKRTSVVGVAIMDNPANFRYPTYWHVRDYGLMTANPFGLSHFLHTPDRDGSHELAANGELCFRYRLYIHKGDAKKGRVVAQYHHYINPPTVEIA